jgi:hypothetical protein
MLQTSTRKMPARVVAVAGDPVARSNMVDSSGVT